jgi:hypothetical protein
MHPLEIMVNVMALAFGVAVLAFLAVLVAAFEFFGVLIAGLVVLLISYTVELEDGSAIGPPQSPGLFAMHRLEQPKNPEEWAAGRAERRARLSLLKVAKLVGAALVTIGALGFYFVQL